MLPLQFICRKYPECVRILTQYLSESKSKWTPYFIALHRRVVSLMVGSEIRRRREEDETRVFNTVPNFSNVDEQLDPWNESRRFETRE